MNTDVPYEEVPEYKFPVNPVEKALTEIFGKPRKFKPYVSVNKRGNTLEVYLEEVNCYHDWIEGEGADISIIRANDDDRAIGVILPLPKNFEGIEIA